MNNPLIHSFRVITQSLWSWSRCFPLAWGWSYSRCTPSVGFHPWRPFGSVKLSVPSAPCMGPCPLFLLPSISVGVLLTSTIYLPTGAIVGAGWAIWLHLPGGWSRQWVTALYPLTISLLGGGGGGVVQINPFCGHPSYGDLDGVWGEFGRFFVSSLHLMPYLFGVQLQKNLQKHFFIVSRPIFNTMSTILINIKINFICWLN